MLTKDQKVLGILLLVILITTGALVYLSVTNYKSSKLINKPIVKQDTLVCDLYQAINLKTNESEHILIDSSSNTYLALDTVLINNNTCIESDIIKDLDYHKAVLGVHIGIVKALPNGIILSINKDYIDDSL